MIYVTGHNFSYTDIDSIVSSIGLAYILNKQGKEAEAVIISPEAIKQTEKDIISHMQDIALPRLISEKTLAKNDIALVDHNDPDESFGALGLKMKPVLCVDHHQDVGYSMDKKIIKKVGSACTLIVQIAREENILFTENIAEALVFGILSDTSGLKSKKTSQEDKDMIAYLYDTYDISKDIDTITSLVVLDTDIDGMTIQELLNLSLKEYNNDQIGIASLEVLDDDYKLRLDEILEHGWKTKYPLYIFLILKLHTSESIVYYFDKKYHCFPEVKNFNTLISRGQDLVPEILKKTEFLN